LDVDEISMRDFMTMTLPEAQYHTSLPPASSTDVTNPRNPDHIFKWMDFEAEAKKWVDKCNDEQTLTKPQFKIRVISEEVPELQPFTKDNLLDNASKCCFECDFVSWGQIDREAANARGKPDFAMRKNQKLGAPVEVKGKWTLPRADLVGDIDRHVQSSIKQIYTYMRHNHRRFGIITTYDFTWFCYRESCCDGKICPLANHDTIYISDGIPINTLDDRPHILQCFGYFNSLITGEYAASPPSSTPASPFGSATDLVSGSRPNSPHVHGLTRGPVTRSKSSVIFDSWSEQNFGVDDFHLKSILGFGRAKVCLEGTLGIAIKYADIWKCPEMLAELRKEVEIYHALSDLQGRFIPELKLYGHWEGSYCIGLSLHGTCPKSLDSAQKQKLVDIIDAIHGLGIIHSDIKKENILVDELGNPFLIDFGFAQRNESRTLQEMERNQLLQCIAVL
jgi:hypothetical protein